MAHVCEEKQWGDTSNLASLNYAELLVNDWDLGFWRTLLISFVKKANPGILFIKEESHMLSTSFN